MNAEAVSLVRIYEHEVFRTEFVSAEQSLRIALARSEKRSFARSIFLCWPNLESAARNLAKVVGHTFPSRGGEGFLLEDALTIACEAYKQAASNSVRDVDAVKAFITSLLDVAAQELPAWRVHGVMENFETTAWEPGWSVFEWIKRKKVEKVVYTVAATKVPSQLRAATRLILTTAVLSLNDIVRIQPAEGEQDGSGQ